MALVLFAALGGTASAEVFDDNPAAVSLGPGNVELFARGPDGRILQRTHGGGVWSDWTAVEGLSVVIKNGGGRVRHEPGPIRPRQRQRAVAEPAPDATWIDWVSRGGTLTSAPTVGLRRSSSTIDGFVHGIDDGMHHRGSSPARAGRVGGSRRQDDLGPAAGRVQQQRLDRRLRARQRRSAVEVLAGVLQAGPRGPDRGWCNEGGGIRGAATMASPEDDVLGVYVRGLDDVLDLSCHTGETTSWMQVDKTPLASSRPPSPIGRVTSTCSRGSGTTCTCARSTPPRQLAGLGHVELDRPGRAAHAAGAAGPAGAGPAPRAAADAHPAPDVVPQGARRSTKLSALRLSRIPPARR